MTFKFKPIVNRKRYSESFDKEKIFITKAGKKMNVYDMIQEGREDTEIYPTLEKYGSIPEKMLDMNKTYADFTTFGGLREIKDQQKQAEQMFYDLPHDVRKQFNNSINTFMKEGKQWVEKKIEALKPKTPTETTTPTTEVNNG